MVVLRAPVLGQTMKHCRLSLSAAPRCGRLGTGAALLINDGGLAPSGPPPGSGETLLSWLNSLQVNLESQLPKRTADASLAWFGVTWPRVSRRRCHRPLCVSAVIGCSLGTLAASPLPCV